MARRKTTKADRAIAQLARENTKRARLAKPRRRNPAPEGNPLDQFFGALFRGLAIALVRAVNEAAPPEPPQPAPVARQIESHTAPLQIATAKLKARVGH